jgi:serpin B
MFAVPVRWSAVSLAVLLASTAAAGGATTVAAADADFAAALFDRLADGRQGNLFVSPYSLRMALAMTATGAAGATAGQMSEALRLPPGPADAAAFARIAAAVANASTDGSEIDVANAIWAAGGVRFRPAFVDRLKADFAASAQTVDFAADPEAAREHINGWVEEQTHKKILDLLPPGSVRSDSRLVLTNAVYFKGAWAEPFLPHRTSDKPFHLDASRDVPVRMMARGTEVMPIFETDTLAAVELPYRGGGVSMLVVIPKAIDGLATVERGLTSDAIRAWVLGLKPTAALLELPKFTARGNYDLASTLADMGMPDAFGHRADFSGMLDATTAPGLCIGGVFHKSFVAVDEQGTEAAAASGIVMRPTAMAPLRHPVELIADRPFLYLIRERTTGTILFIGRCADPRR